MVTIAIIMCIGCLLVLITEIQAFIVNTAIARNTRFIVSRLPAFKENEKDEQMKLQAEMLARRKNKSKMKEYFENVEKKREQTSKDASKTFWAKSKDEVDPLQKWKVAKDKGEIKDIGYDAAPPRSASKFGLNIVIPVNPIGIPKYDNGERFDLRLPYAERGYEDLDADVMGKLGRGLGGILGSKKKDSSSPPASKSPEKPLLLKRRKRRTGGDSIERTNGGKIINSTGL